MVQLSESLSSFEETGIGVAATTYDSPEVLAEFDADNKIGYTLLSDAGGTLAQALGILNESYEPGHFAHGIPHPGILILDRDGQVLAKFALEDYRNRPAMDEVLAEVRKLN